MFDQKIRETTEALARTVSRRKFLAQMGTTVFGGVAALAAGQALAGSAYASNLIGSGGGKKGNPLISCSPPGPYCNIDGVSLPSGCNGGHCLRHLSGGQMLFCRVYYTYYQSGCWTTASSGGYWTCCDCECSATPGGPRVSTCGCAQFSTGPVPMPDAPSSISA